MSKVEEVARAIVSAGVGELSFDQWPDEMQEVFLRQARAAIEAMQEPTEEMVIAGVHHENMGEMAGRWQAMINIALKN